MHIPTHIKTQKWKGFFLFLFLNTLTKHYETTYKNDIEFLCCDLLPDLGPALNSGLYPH